MRRYLADLAGVEKVQAAKRASARFLAFSGVSPGWKMPAPTMKPRTPASQKSAMALGSRPPASTRHVPSGSTVRQARTAWGASCSAGKAARPRAPQRSAASASVTVQTPARLTRPARLARRTTRASRLGLSTKVPPARCTCETCRGSRTCAAPTAKSSGRPSTSSRKLSSARGERRLTAAARRPAAASARATARAWGGSRPSSTATTGCAQTAASHLLWAPTMAGRHPME
mmetsp:Transcript_91988/g.297700  ORF Transcript_91988/g.297700 Transcript_91988/m.297700 type:complete len:230 (+) Transcript_91988:53-742(+)